MNMLIMSSSTFVSINCRGELRLWQEIIINAWKERKQARKKSVNENPSKMLLYLNCCYTWRAKIKKVHILSKLLNICKNERISTKFVLPSHVFWLPLSVISWNHHKKLYYQQNKTEDGQSLSDHSSVSCITVYEQNMQSNPKPTLLVLASR